MPRHGARHILKESHVFEDNYRIVRELGRGGFGIIYLAHQISMDRPVALKILKPGVCDLDPTARKRFLREVKIISKLRHPNSVTIHDFGETDDGIVFMVLEYVDGETLDELLQREGPQPPMRALGLTRQIARALAEAHDHGIVHRDLKPANIMLSDLEGDSDFVKVLDFGVARLRDSDVDLTSVGVPDGQRSLMGTPRYMSPEQVRGEELSAASDLYSLGLLLFEMLFATPAVTGDAVLDLVRQQNSTDPLALDELDGLPASLQQLIRRATSKSLEARFQSGEEFATAIDETAQQLSAAPGADPSASSQEFMASSGRFSSVGAVAATGSDVAAGPESNDGGDWLDSGFSSEDFSEDELSDDFAAEDISRSEFSAEDFADDGDDVEALFPDIDDEIAAPGPPEDDPPPMADDLSVAPDAAPSEQARGPTLIDDADAGPSNVALGDAIARQSADDTSALGFALIVFGLCILGALAGGLAFVVFLVIGALVGEFLGGSMRVIIAAGVAISIPVFAALNETQAQSRSQNPDSGSRRLAKIFVVTILVCVGATAIASFALPTPIIDDLRDDPDGIFDDSSLHRSVSLSVADIVEQSATAAGRYDEETDEVDEEIIVDSPFVAPPEPTRPATREASTPPPTRPSTTDDSDDDQ